VTSKVGYIQALLWMRRRRGERATDDPKVIEIEFVEQRTDKRDHRDNPAPERRQLTNPLVAWAS
jgi:hypothetical protein